MKDVQNATTFTFSDLNALTEYSLTVQAVRNGEKTKPSAEVVVTTTDSTNAIEAINADKLTDGRMYDLSGRRVIDTNAKGVYIKKQNGKTVKQIVR